MRDRGHRRFHESRTLDRHALALALLGLSNQLLSPGHVPIAGRAARAPAGILLFLMIPWVHSKPARPRCLPRGFAAPGRFDPGTSLA